MSVDQDIREVRADIGKLHEKLDRNNETQVLFNQSIDKRVLTLEINYANKGPYPERPCETLKKHLVKHKETETQELQEIQDSKNRIWRLFLVVLPYLLTGIGTIATIALAHIYGVAP